MRNARSNTYYAASQLLPWPAKERATLAVTPVASRSYLPISLFIAGVRLCLLQCPSHAAAREGEVVRLGGCEERSGAAGGRLRAFLPAGGWCLVESALLAAAGTPVFRPVLTASVVTELAKADVSEQLAVAESCAAARR